AVRERRTELASDAKSLTAKKRSTTVPTEYVRGDAHTNTAESRFSLMKRAVYGPHHSVSQAHLPRYLAEWDFKWNTRKVKAPMTSRNRCNSATTAKITAAIVANV